MSDKSSESTSDSDTPIRADANSRDEPGNVEIDIQDEFGADKRLIKRYKNNIYDKIQHFDNVINKDNHILDLFVSNSDQKHGIKSKSLDNRVKLERMLKDFDIISGRNSIIESKTEKLNLEFVHEQHFTDTLDTDSINKDILLLNRYFDDINLYNKDIMNLLHKERAKFNEMSLEMDKLDKVEKDIEETSSEIDELLNELRDVDLDEMERYCAQLEDEINALKTSSSNKDNKSFEISDDINSDINRLRVEIDKLDKYRRDVKDRMRKFFTTILNKD